MKIVYSEHCDCAREDLRVAGFEPEWLDDEQLAGRKHVDAEVRLQRGDGKRYFAFHFKGGHILTVRLGPG